MLLTLDGTLNRFVRPNQFCDFAAMPRALSYLKSNAGISITFNNKYDCIWTGATKTNVQFLNNVYVDQARGNKQDYHIVRLYSKAQFNENFKICVLLVSSASLNHRSVS